MNICAPSIDSGGTGPEITPINQALTVPTGPLSNPYPNGILLPVGHNLNINQPYSQFSQTLAGSSLDSRETNEKYPTVYQFNLSLQRSLGTSGTIEADYAGSHGSHMPISDYQINQLPDQYDSMGSALLATPSSNPFTGLIGPTSPIVSTGGSNKVVGQFLRPFPQFLAVDSSVPWIAGYSYNALEGIAQNHFHGGSNVLLSYTWAKLMSNYDTQNGYLEGKTVGTVQDFDNINAERSESGFDVRQRLSASYIFNVPLGHDQAFLSHSGPAVDKAVSGWTVSGITTLQSGYPVSLIYSTGTTLQTVFGAGQARPNYTPGCSVTTGGPAAQRITEWFNTGCYTAPPPYGFGNERRVDSGILTQGIANTDLTAAKNTAITERVSLEFRADIFNLFNRVQFSAPNTQLGSPLFGTITSILNNPRQSQMSLTLKF